MVKVNCTSGVKVFVNSEEKICSHVVHYKAKGNVYPISRYPSKNLEQQQDIERQLSDLTDHFDSKLELLNNLILKELTEKINKIEKSVINIGVLHNTLLEKIGNLESLIALMKNEQDDNIQIQEIKDLKYQISLLQTKVSAIQEQKKLLISRMTEFDAVKQHIHDTENQSKFNHLEKLDNSKVEQTTEDLVTLMSKLATTTSPPGADPKLNAARTLLRSNRKRGPSKKVAARFKFIHLKNKFLTATRKMRFKQNKGQAV